MIKKKTKELLAQFNPIRDEFVEIRLLSSSLAFSTLLSLIPFLVLVLAGFQYIGGFENLYPKIEALLLSYLRDATGPQATRFIRRAITRIDYQALGISGLIFLFWTTIGLIRNMDYAFNRLWKIQTKVPFYKRLWLHTLILMCIPVGLAIFIGTKSLLLIDQGMKSLEHASLLTLFVCAFMIALYKVIPATKVQLKPAFISGVFAGVSFLILQKSFLWVSLKVFKENKVYGTMASFPIFLVWLVVVWHVVLVGASLCAFLQQRSSKSS
jgi:membrane protein